MSILLVESFELAASDVMDITLGEDGKYLNAETRSAFWAWTESRKDIVVSLPQEFTKSIDGQDLDLFTRQQISEMTNAAGIILK
jgi:hypothetical protein